MKKVLTLLLFCIATVVYAEQLGNQINLSAPIIDPDLDGPHTRMPILVPVLYLDGYTLTAGNGTLGATIQILDEDGNVVFSTYIYVEGDIELPATLTGTYTIEVIRGSQTFVGEITL